MTNRVTNATAANGQVLDFIFPSYLGLEAEGCISRTIKTGKRGG
jgi:hypothetical protein